MLVFDIESDGLLTNITKVHCINLIDRSTGREYRFTDHKFYQDVDGKTTDVEVPRAGTIAQGLKTLADAKKLGGQNIIEYDIPALKVVFPDFETKAQLYDTKVMSKAMYPDLKDRDFAAIRKHRLPKEFMAKGLVGTNKLESWGVRIGKQMKDDFNPKDFGHTWQSMPFTQIFDDYCMQDVRTNVDIFEHFESKPFYCERALDVEHKVAELLFEQTQEGVHFDEEGAEKLLAILQPRHAEIGQECAAVFHPWYAPDGKFAKTPCGKHGNRGLFVPKRDNKKMGYLAGVPFTKVKQVVFNPASRDQIASRLIAIYGWRPLEKTDTGKAKVDETILSALPYPEAKKLAEFFTINKRLGQLAEGKEAWMKKVKNGKIHGRVDTLGAITNRMTHMSPNLAQVPANHAPYGVECRSLFGPPPGMKQVGMDADGLEGRCLGHYLYRWDQGAFIKTILEGSKKDGTDLHSKNRDAVGIGGEDKDEARDGAKTIFYGWMYGAGDFKLGMIFVEAMDEEQREKFYAKFPAGKKRDAAIVRLGRRSRDRLVSGIAGMEYLIKAVQSKAKSGWLRAIDGRRLRVRSQHAALNTLLQGMGAIVMKYALVIAHDDLCAKFGYKTDFAYMLNIHDEVQLWAKPEIAEEIGAILADAVRKAGEVLETSCPLEGSFEVGDNWSQTH